MRSSSTSGAVLSAVVRKAASQAELEEAATYLVRIAQQGEGVAAADAFVSRRTRVTVRIDEGHRTVTRSEHVGGGVHVQRHGSLGFASAALGVGVAPEDVVDAAMHNASFGSPVLSRAFPGPMPDRRDVRLGALSACADVEAKDLSALANTLVELSRNCDSRVLGCRPVLVQWEHVAVALANSADFAGSYCGCQVDAIVNVIAAGQDDRQTWLAHARGSALPEIHPDTLVLEAVTHATGMLGARRCLPDLHGGLVLSARAMAGILGATWPVLGGQSSAAQTWPYRESYGTRAASTLVSIIDDPHLEDGPAFRPFDGEGFPTVRKILVRNGTVCDLLQTAYTCRRSAVGSPGNASRSYDHPPRVGPSNLLLAPGERGPVRLPDAGLWIGNVQGLHTADPTTGRFALAADGRAIRGGALEEPVAGLRLRGSLPEMLANVTQVGNELAYATTRKGIAAPSVALPDLRVFVK
jgi:PmbA protein